MIGYHAGERWSPQSRFMVWGSVWIWIASIVLFQKPCAVPRTRAPFQLMLWLVVPGMYGYAVLLTPLLHCLLVFTNSDLQCSLGLPNVYLRAVLARNLVDHFLLLLFRHLLLHSHKLLFQCTLGLEDSFHSKQSTGLLKLLTECPQWLLFFWFMCLLSLRFG